MDNGYEDEPAQPRAGNPFFVDSWWDGPGGVGFGYWIGFKVVGRKGEVVRTFRRTGTARDDQRGPNDKAWQEANAFCRKLNAGGACRERALQGAQRGGGAGTMR